MIYILMCLITCLISVLFFFIAQIAVRKQQDFPQQKTPDFIPQVFLRVFAVAIGLGEFYLLKYLQKVLFISPQNGYDLTQGVNFPCAIGIVITMICFVVCLDHIFFPGNTNVRKNRPFSFHLGFKIRPALMTITIFVSTLIVILNILNYTYYKTGGTIFIRENMGFSTKQYTKSDIRSVVLNTYQGKGNTFTDIILTFSDGRTVTSSADGEGSKMFLSEWHGQIQKTNNQP